MEGIQKYEKTNVAENTEREPIARAIVFVPGLGESASEIYQDVLRGLQRDLAEIGEEKNDTATLNKNTSFRCEYPS